MDFDCCWMNSWKQKMVFDWQQMNFDWRIMNFDWQQMDFDWREINFYDFFVSKWRYEIVFECFCGKNHDYKSFWIETKKWKIGLPKRPFLFQAAVNARLIFYPIHSFYLILQKIRPSRASPALKIENPHISIVENCWFQRKSRNSQPFWKTAFRKAAKQGWLNGYWLIQQIENQRIVCRQPSTVVRQP